MGGILLNIKIIGGLALICVIIVVAGVLFYNSNNQGADNKTKNSTNTVNNTTNTSTNQLSLSLSVNNQPNPSPSPGPGPSPGPTPPGPTPDPMDHTISLFDQYVKSTFLKASNAGLPGAAVVLIYKGRIVSINTLGVRDLESKLPVTPDTLFLLASVTKTFTATNVAQQVDKGLMRWNDTVKSYFNDPDEFYLYDPVAYDNLTIADCLKHTSGIPDAEGIWKLFGLTTVIHTCFIICVLYKIPVH